jgi:hypothetical protein
MIHGTDGTLDEHYKPLCRRCHVLYDGQVANLPDNTGSRRTPDQRRRMSDAAKQRWSDPAQREQARLSAIRREARRRAARSDPAKSVGDVNGGGDQAEDGR